MTWTLQSETGRLRDVLLCRPDNYAWIPTNAIARATLSSGTPLDRARLDAEYAEFEAALDQAGVTRHYLTPEAHLKYQVYTRDSSQVSPLGPVLTCSQCRSGAANMHRSWISTTTRCGKWRPQARSRAAIST
ncbi:MAG: hypothetical protein RLZZ413_1504 [Pseudomonadota bacterium]